ncbi:hypothetical protein DHD80_13390 [Gramella sp. AN32]|nr:hypothetical protein [Gramella sp. AN32]
MWHYHPELKLMLIIKSIGTLFIGDSLEKKGEIGLSGELPLYKDIKKLSNEGFITENDYSIDGGFIKLQG